MRSMSTHINRRRFFTFCSVVGLASGLTWVYFGYWLSGLGALFMSIYFQNILSMSYLEERIDLLEQEMEDYDDQ